MEKRRAGKSLERLMLPMHFSHASRLLNGAILVLKTMGWAWRWAEWWVEHGSSWEPLLEVGEREEDMTKEQLRIVDSTPESRCEEARRCRLAAFGAALRNREYDVDDGFHNVSLHRALKAVLRSKALVGPLDDAEIDFLTEWLGRAYRSKSRLLGFGEDKIEVASEYFCLHQEDRTPKYELGKRLLPGKQELPDGDVFESSVDEIDDFLKSEVFDGATIIQSIEKQTLKSEASKLQTKPAARRKSLRSDPLSNSDSVKPKVELDEKDSSHGESMNASVPVATSSLNRRKRQNSVESKTSDVSFEPSSVDSLPRGDALAASTRLGRKPGSKRLGRPPKSIGSSPLQANAPTPVLPISSVSSIPLDGSRHPQNAVDDHLRYNVPSLKMKILSLFLLFGTLCRKNDPRPRIRTLPLFLLSGALCHVGENEPGLFWEAKHWTELDNKMHTQARLRD